MCQATWGGLSQVSVVVPQRPVERIRSHFWSKYRPWPIIVRMSKTRKKQPSPKQLLRCIMVMFLKVSCSFSRFLHFATFTIRLLRTKRWKIDQSVFRIKILFQCETITILFQCETINRTFFKRLENSNGKAKCVEGISQVNVKIYWQFRYFVSMGKIRDLHESGPNVNFKIQIFSPL